MSENFDPVTGEAGNRMPGEKTGGDAAAPEPEAGQAFTGTEPEAGQAFTDAEPAGVFTAQGQWGNGAAQEPQASFPYFDPATGMAAGMGDAPSINFMEPPKLPEKKNRNALWITLCVAAAVLLAVVSAAFMAKSGIFMGNSGKVLSAMTNTFSYRSRLAEDVAPVALIMAKQDYTLGLEVEMPEDDMTVGMEYRSLPSEKQVALSVDMSFFPTVHMIASMTPEKVGIHIPILDKRIFTYYIGREKTGYLAEAFTEEELEEIDGFFEELFGDSETEKRQEMAAEILMKWYQSMEFEKAGTREYEVNGQKKECAGYRLMLVSEDMTELLTDLEDLIFAEYPYSLYNPYGDDFDMLWYLFEDMPDMDLTFYLYKNRVEGILMESAYGEEVEIICESDKKGNLDIDIDFMGETMVEMERCITGSAESYSFREYDSDSELEFTYDFRSGDMMFDMEDFYSEYSFQGNLQSDAKSVTFTMDYVEYDGEETGFKVWVEKGAVMEEVEGEELDVGAMSEEEWYELLDGLLW